MEANEKAIKTQINDCVELVKNILGKDLLAIYLYGSSLIGGLQKFSDIDLFVVSSRKTNYEEKKLLEKALLKISGKYMVDKNSKPIELTIVVKSDVNPWQYPPKFDFLYGDWLRDKFEGGNIEPWPSKDLPNLALVITQLLLSNKILFGLPPGQILEPVPYKDFMSALTVEVSSLMNDIEWDTRNVLLTLARIWNTVDTDVIRSKSDAASWAIEKLPEGYKQVLGRAKSILLGEKNESWNDLKDLIKPCANYMVKQIKRKNELIHSPDFSQKAIKVA
jgi:streptomycin 3"-adenylyltransferase